MESLGIVRKIDETGRIVLPKDFRRRLGIEPNVDAVELFADGDQIIIKKYSQKCVFCSSSEDTFEFLGQRVCKKCSENLQKVIELQNK